LQAAESGLGIISFSQESPLLQASSVMPVLPHIKGPTINIYYIYPKESADLKKIQAFLSYLQTKILPLHHKIR